MILQTEMNIKIQGWRKLTLVKSQEWGHLTSKKKSIMRWTNDTVPEHQS
jgi:hypothetical protein